MEWVCEECGRDLEGEDIFCETCMMILDAEIERLTNENNALKDEIESLERQIADYESD